MRQTRGRIFFAGFIALIFLLPIAGLQSCNEEASANEEKDSTSAMEAKEDALANEEESTAFTKPKTICSLPGELHEISALTNLGQSIACLQDESGIIYFFNPATCSIEKKMQFEYGGDFEGLARAGKIYYALRSDGTLFKIEKLDSGKPKVDKISAHIPAADNEGLCYDAKMNRLLIAPKQNFEDKKMAKEFRPVYAYDLGKDELIEEPVIRINLQEATTLITERMKGKELKTKKKSKKPSLQFNISDLALHPSKELLYLLSSSDQLVLITDMQGKPVDVILLDKKVFPQPEGITFLDDGSLVISTEGVTKKAAIGIF